MELTKTDLHNVFIQAREQGSKYVFIGIKAIDAVEIIVVPRYSFIEKQFYYERAYNENLRLHTTDNVRMVQLKHGGQELLEEMEGKIKNELN